MGVRLPAFGMMANQPQLTIETDAVLGPVPATAITTSPAVGLFAEAALSFNQQCTGDRTTGLTLTFRLLTKILSGETLVMRLPSFGFSGPVSTDFPVACNIVTGKSALSLD